MPSSCFEAGSRRGSGSSALAASTRPCSMRSRNCSTVKPGAGLSGGNGVEIGTVGILVRKDGSSGLFQTPSLLPPNRPTGDLRDVYVQDFGFAPEGLPCLYVMLRCLEVVVDGRCAQRSRSGGSREGPSAPSCSAMGSNSVMAREVLHAADQLVVLVHEGKRQASPVLADGDKIRSSRAPVGRTRPAKRGSASCACDREWPGRSAGAVTWSSTGGSGV